MNIELFQPWSSFIMKTELPEKILKQMLEVTGKLIKNENTLRWGHQLAGQIKEELYIDHGDVVGYMGFMEYFNGVFNKYVKLQKEQNFPLENINYEYKTNTTHMWIVSQYDDEYNPNHMHTNCDMSCVMYLKVPKFLPDRKPSNQPDSYPSQDGNIMFSGPSTDGPWSNPFLSIAPKVGDFYIFGSKQVHAVYPFRTKDGKGERRSVSMNVNITDTIEINKDTGKHVRTKPVMKKT